MYSKRLLNLEKIHKTTLSATNAAKILLSFIVFLTVLEVSINVLLNQLEVVYDISYTQIQEIITATSLILPVVAILLAVCVPEYKKGNYLHSVKETLKRWISYAKSTIVNNWLVMIISIVGILALQLFLSLILTKVLGIKSVPVSFQTNVLKSINNNPFVSLALLATPVWEEAIFRFVLPTIFYYLLMKASTLFTRNSYTANEMVSFDNGFSAIIAALLANTLFALSHFGGSFSVTGFIVILAVGLFLQFLQYKTKSYTILVGTHVGMNLLVLLINIIS